MSVLEVLREVEKRQGEETLTYQQLALDQILSRHATIVELEGFLLPSKISIFSQLELGSVISVDQRDLHLNYLRAGDLTIRIGNA